MGENRYITHTHDHPAKSIEFHGRNIKININNVMSNVHILTSANRRLYTQMAFDTAIARQSDLRVNRSYPPREEFT